MTEVLKGHFDGRVIVPDSPVDLPLNQPLVIQVQPDQSQNAPDHGTVEYVARQMENHLITDEDAQLIEESCERIEPTTAIDFDSSPSGHERSD
jgi:hypothetical protein